MECNGLHVFPCIHLCECLHSRLDLVRMTVYSDAHLQSRIAWPSHHQILHDSWLKADEVHHQN